jgi:hypothetical protein
MEESCGTLCRNALETGKKPVLLLSAPPSPDEIHGPHAE